MRYQLVLQFPADSIEDYDEVIALEETLTDKLGETADVDGHDCGVGEMNVFIFVDEPDKIFNRIKPILAKRKNFEELIAAYRERTGEEYTVLWPVDYDRPFRIA